MSCHTAAKKVKTLTRHRRACPLAIVPMSPSLPTDGVTLQMVGRRQQHSPLGLPLGPEGSAALGRFPGGPSTALPSGALRLPSRPLDAAATSHRWSMTLRQRQPMLTVMLTRYCQCVLNTSTNQQHLLLLTPGRRRRTPFHSRQGSSTRCTSRCLSASAHTRATLLQHSRIKRFEDSSCLPLPDRPCLPNMPRA